MQKSFFGSRLGLVLACGLFVVAACGGDDDDDVSSVGGDAGDAGGTSGSSGSSGTSSTSGGGPDGSTGLTGVPLRLGMIGTVTGDAVSWTLRLYGTGAYRQPDGDGRECGVPALQDGCLLEHCVDDIPGVDAGAPAATTWTGVVNVVDETRAITLRIDLATLAVPTSTSVSTPLELPGAAANDVIHLTTENVANFFPLDTRLVIPTPADIALGGTSLGYSQGTAFANVVAPGEIRIDISESQGMLHASAVCFFDRGAAQSTIPPLSQLGLPCAETSALTALPIGASRAILNGPDGKQALVYVVTGDTKNYLTGLACSP